MTGRHYDAVIWDMDGVLFDTESLVIDCWKQVCLEHGYPDPTASLMKMIGRSEKDSDAIFREDFGEGFDVQRLRERKNELVLRKIQKGMPIKKGVVETLRLLQAMNVSSAVGSSTNAAKVRQFLRHGGIDSHFPVVVGGDMVRRGKPDPEIFLRAAKELSVDPRRCVVIEDSLNGVRAGFDAGMCVVLVPDLVVPTEEMLEKAHHVLPALSEAEPLMRHFFSGMNLMESEFTQ
jgi:HAD superfamily hydrolase (TIGR01509 family)